MRLMVAFVFSIPCCCSPLFGQSQTTSDVEPGGGSPVLNAQTDRKPPAVSISFPRSGTAVTNPAITIVGTAADKIGLVRVEYRLENAGRTNDYQTAVGTTQWSADISGLVPGINTVRVRAFDTSGNASPAVARSFTYLVLSPLTVSVSGNGSVSPNLNGRLLQVGAAYKITARPGPGFIFSDWTGVSGTADASLTFVMQSNLVLRANFVPNPFASAQGNYAGLLSDSNGPAFDNSGWLSAKVTSSGRFTAKLQLAGKAYQVSGQFAADGTFAGAVSRRGLPPLSAQLHLDLAGADQMDGTIGDGSFTAQVVAHRATFSRNNPAPPGGRRYTLVCPPASGSSLAPDGYGYGTLTVDVAGNVRFAGALGDGTKVSQSTFLSKSGEWPLFASLYRGKGSLLGSLVIDGSDLSGRINWFKLPESTAKLYPSGFALTNAPQIAGSVYSYTKGVPVLTLPNGGQVILANGDLSGSITNAFGLAANNRVSGSNRLTAAITPTTGLFRGKALNPANNRFVTFAGALVQNQNAGWGYFPGTNSTGQVYFGPAEFQPPPPRPAVTVVASLASASENGPTPGTFTIIRTMPFGPSLTVNYTVSGTATGGADYTALSGSVTIPPGNASANVMVNPIDDSVPEGVETVVLTLSPVVTYTVGSPNSATVTIADNDLPPPPTVTIVATDPTASESEPSWGSFTISRTGSTIAELTVNYAVSGTAANGSDYATLIGTITIPEDSPSASITVIPVDDAISETDETVVLTLSADAGYTIGSPNSATVTITDNESPPPARILNLTDWKLTLPVETPRDGSPDEVKQPELGSYQDSSYFRVNDTEDGVVFAAPCGGATTSGSSYPRSELREMRGSSQASWSTMIGTHTMEIRQAITHLPIVKPHVVAGQIHDATDDVIVFRLEDTKLFVDQNGVNGPVLTQNYQLGDVFTAKFVARDGGIECYYNGQYIYTHPVNALGCYFKAGCYTQSNTSRGDPPNAYGEVVIYSVTVKHE